MSFQKKKVPLHNDGRVHERKKPVGAPSSPVNKKLIIFIITFVICFGVVLFVRASVKPYLQKSVQRVGQGAVSVISKVVGTPPQTDAYGHINAMILGYGGEGHEGSYLSDSIMIASFNPANGGVTFLSVPRDLYIEKTLGGYGKINGDFASLYYYYEKNLIDAGSGFAAKLTQITGIPIQYYFMIDFPGFETLIDKLGGVDIDVPYPIYDTTYPGPNNSFTTFSIDAGLQHMSGDIALKYARSRHSTSDFARSLRQQQIIKAVLQKIFSFDNVTSPSKIKQLYAQFQDVVHTNMTVDEIIGSMQYAYKIKQFSSFQYAVCNSYRWETAEAGCLLYSPSMDEFGSSVELPVEANAAHISEYGLLHEFATQVVYNSGYLVENAAIRILNGVDTGTLTALKGKSIASATAMDYVKMGLRVFDIGNADQTYQQTTLLINGTGDYTDTINQMKKIIAIPQITGGTYTPDGPSLTLILGNDYQSGAVEKKPRFLNY